MGIMKEMFGDEGGSAYDIPVGEHIATGEYDSRADEILRGYKVFRKKYVYKSMVWKLLLAALAMAYSVIAIIDSKGEDMLPVFCLLLSLFIGFWFINTPVNNAKKLKAGLGELEGTVYRAEFYTDRIKISTPYVELPEEEPPEVEGTEEPESGGPGEAEEKPESAENESGTAEREEGAEDVPEGETSEEEKIPASVIHLDQPIVTLIEKEEIFLLVVKKQYVFIIPKRGFADEDVARIREKLSVIMGVRYKGS